MFKTEIDRQIEQRKALEQYHAEKAQAVEDRRQTIMREWIAAGNPALDAAAHAATVLQSEAPTKEQAALDGANAMYKIFGPTVTSSDGLRFMPPNGMKGLMEDDEATARGKEVMAQVKPFLKAKGAL